MVIDPNNRLPASGSNTARNRSASGVNQTNKDTANQASDKKASTENDNVLLSSEAKALKRLEAQINASPDIDNTRVAAIKRAIAEGKFEINVERIAENILKQDGFFG